MIIGIGNDLVQIERIEKSLAKFGRDFITRILSKSEISEFEEISNPQVKSAFLAKRFAAKEATAKAVGTGIRQNVSWQDMCLTHDDLGKPLMQVSGAVEQHLKQSLPTGQKYAIHVSLSDEVDYALAFVVIETINKE